MGSSSIAFAGIGTATATVAGLGERTTRITILARGDQAARTARVNKSWLEQTKRATAVKNSVKNALRGRSDVHTIGIRSADQTIGGLRAESVDVQVSPDGSLDGIPSAVDGVSVVAEKSEPPVPTSCSDCYCGYTSDVYGGETCNNSIENSTLGCRVFYNGSTYLLAARHSFVGTANDSYCQNSLNTEGWSRAGHEDETPGIVATDDSGNPLAFKKHDAVLVKLRDFADESITNDVADVDGKMVGRVTENGLDFLSSNSNYTVHKRGRTTCETNGYVKKIQQEILCNGYPTVWGVVRSTPEQKQGDSGGPVYFKELNSSEPDDLYLVNIATHSKVNDGSYDAQGSSANDMYNDQGIWYGGNPYDGE